MKNVTDIINIYYFKNGVIKIDNKYNSIFSDICYGKKKELVINYIDNDDRHKNVNYLEDKPVLINNVKAIEKCIYKPLNDNKNNFDIKYIYDVLHNDNNKLIIIMPSEINPPCIEYMHYLFSLHICPDKHTYIYELHIETDYKKNIILFINNKEYSVNVNKYPEFKNEIIMSTIVKNEDNFIRQWINFHYNIGVKHFIIYDNSDNSDKSNLKYILRDFIKNKIVILIEWYYPYTLNISGISGQTTQQNHSLYAFKNSKYLGFFDIDEYVNIQNNTNIDCFFNSIIEDYKIDTNNIGCFQIKNKNFHNSTGSASNNYNFLLIFTCDNITNGGREKNFVLPKNVDTFSVHRITSGKETFTVNPKYIYFNHYIFLNKSNRGKGKRHLKDKTILQNCKFIDDYNIVS